MPCSLTVLRMRQVRRRGSSDIPQHAMRGGRQLHAGATASLWPMLQPHRGSCRHASASLWLMQSCNIITVAHTVMLQPHRGSCNHATASPWLTQSCYSLTVAHGCRGPHMCRRPVLWSCGKCGVSVNGTSGKCSGRGDAVGHMWGMRGGPGMWGA